MFCVECGREGPTVEGLCASCTVKRRTLIRPPEAIDVSVCAHCGRLDMDGIWVRVDLEQAIPMLLPMRIPVDPRATRPAFTHVAKREDGRNLRLTVKFTARVGDVEVVVPFQTRLRVKRSVCLTCSRQAGQYFEAIVQVRATGRDLRSDEIDRITRIVDARFSEDRGSEEFVGKVDETEGGVDVYVSSGTGGHAAAKTVAEAFGGQVRASPKIHGRKDGRDVYRVTYHVRIPGFRRGDLLRFQGRLYRVKEGVREGAADVEAIDLEDWTSTRIRVRDLKRAEPLPGRIERFRVLEATRSEVVVERDGERIVVPRPANWVPAAEVPGIAVEDGIRLVPEV